MIEQVDYFIECQTCAIVVGFMLYRNKRIHLALTAIPPEYLFERGVTPMIEVAVQQFSALLRKNRK